MIRVSVYIENVQTLTDDDLLRVIAACDTEIARCKIVAKSMIARYKLHKLQEAKAIFVSEKLSRQMIEC